MNSFRKFVPALLLGLTIAMSGAGFAQNVMQTDADKKMDSCCCCGDSCSMKDGAMKTATTSEKHACCCGDSCPMKDGAMKTGATTSEKHDCCCGDSCPMTKDGAVNHAAMNNGATSDKHECCCCGGDSCNMKDMKKMKEMKNKGQ